MFGLRNLLNSIRGLGTDRLKLLGIVAGGHSVMHWYMESFSVILPSLKLGMGLNDIQIGTLMSARQVASGTLNFPAGILADSLVGYRPLFLASAPIVMGMAYMLVGISYDFTLTIMAVVMIGFAIALWHPAALATLSNRFPEHRATVVAVHGMGASISNTITPLGIGSLLVIFHWRNVLGFQIIPALLAAFLLWRSLIKVIGTPTERQSGANQMKELGNLARDTAFLGISVIRGFQRMGRLVVLTFLPIYLQEHLGYSPFLVGLHLTFLYGVGTFSQPIMAFLSDRLGRKTVLLPSFFVLGVFYLLFAVVAPGIQLGLLICFTGILFFTLGNITTAAVMDVSDSRIQASSFGLSSFMTQLLALPAPILAGFISTKYGIASTFILSGGLLIFAGLLLAPLRISRA